MFFIYRSLTIFFFPLIALIIYFRKLQNKEDPIRFKEKIFLPNQKNSKKANIWFHGASVGEVTSVFPLVDYLTNRNKNLRILITSVTISASKIIEKKYKNNKNVIHKYFPLDIPHLNKKFLNNWKPDLIFFIDSEIWPNFIYEIKKRKITLGLINARITKKTYSKWNLLKVFSKKIFSSFNICIASSKESVKYLRDLNAKNIKYFGNLKYISNLKKIKNLDKQTLNYFKNHKVWCAASTHQDEEIFCIKTHIVIKKKYKNVLTIIIPRHINRVESIADECKEYKLKFQIIRNKEKINKNTEIILVKSFGVLPNYYKYCDSVFIGKSLLKRLMLVGGQNPIEAAKLGCKIYHGPYTYNFLEVYNYLNKNKFAEKINNIEELSAKLIRDFKKLKKNNRKNIKKIDDYGNQILRKTIKEIDYLGIK